MNWEPLTARELAEALLALEGAQDYAVWIEADPSSPVLLSDIKVDHDRREVRL